MNISNYKIGDIYRKSVLLREWDSPVYDAKNSYGGTTASMMGAGNGQPNASDMSPNNFKDEMMFPKEDDVDNSEKKRMLIKFLKDEIDDGSFNASTKAKFRDLLDHLLGVDPELEQDQTDKKKAKASKRKTR
jgi:hypothetical protein